MKQAAGTITIERATTKPSNKWVKLAEVFREMRSGNADRAMKAWKEITE